MPSEIWHISDGKSLDKNYMICLEELINNYKNNFDYINITIKKWKTKGLFAFFYRKYYYVKQTIKKLLVKH